MNETYLSQKDFEKIIITKIQKTMKELYASDVKISVNNVLKTNGEKRGISTIFANGSPAPTTYVEDLFEEYKRGIPLEDIAVNHCRAIEEFKNNLPKIPELSLEEAKKSILLTMVNTELNQKLLLNVPHFDLEGGISAIPRWIISPEASFIVTKNMAAEVLKLTPDEVLKIGQDNINAMDYKIQTIQDVLRGILISESMSTDVVDSLYPKDEGTIPMLVITSPNNMQGANCLLSDRTLQRVSQIIGDDVVLIGSSIHEVIAMPYRSMEPAEIRKMVHDINMTEVSEADFLSDNIWKYDGIRLSLIPEDLSLKKQMDTPDMSHKVHYAGMSM